MKKIGSFVPLLAVLAFAASAPLAAQPPRAAGPSPEALTQSYVERYFATFPSRATAAGRKDHDRELEDLDADHRAAWISFQLDTRKSIEGLLAGEPSDEDRRDLELLDRQVELEIWRWMVQRQPERDPLFWSGLASQANVFLLVREDRPAAERLEAAVRRAEQLPRLLAQARSALDLAADDELSSELASLAASQLRRLATFYRSGFSGVARQHAEPLVARFEVAGSQAADSLDRMAGYLDERSGRATGSARAGRFYHELFRLYTGLEIPPSEVEKAALDDLEAKRREAAAVGRKVWKKLRGDEPIPDSDDDLLRVLFRQIEQNRADSVEAFVADYRQLSEASIRFVRERDLVTLPDPMPIWIGTSPDYFVGQGVGGVYPPGPYAEGAPTLLFLPTPPSDADEAGRNALFAAFNHPFNTMITPHELVPGHTLQLATAARHPRKVRALFPDDVYVEGWGTFAERLMLDLGWGDAEARLAHLKKQLENIARLIVDIRLHSTDASEEDILRFVRDEALQDEQFARNMWMRALTSSPQLTSYHLGYRRVMGLYEDVRTARGESFRIKDFLDGMMELGPVPVAEYRARMLPEPTEDPAP